MARVTRSRSREFRREMARRENSFPDTEKEMEERRIRREEQLKNDTRYQRRLAKEQTMEERRKEKEERPELSPRERKVRRHRRFLYAAVLVVMLVFIGQALWKAVQVKALETAAYEEEQRLEEELNELKQELEYADTEEYIEEKARTELHMIYPGETLYLVEEKAGGEDENNEQEKAGKTN